MKIAFALLLAAGVARADDIALHAFVDGYYAWNGNDPASHESFIPGTGTTAKRANELNLNLAAVELVKDAAPPGFHLSLVAGNGAGVVHAAESEGFRHIYQASVIYKPNGRLTLEGGIFPSHIGFEAFFSKDNIATWKATPALSLGGPLDRGHQQHANWLGLGGYARYAIDDQHAVAFRAERFRDSDNGISGFAQELTEATVTYEVRPTPNLIFKLEGRRDRSTASVFDGSKSQTLVVAGAVATF